MECKNYRVAVIGGDGIGPEVCDAAKQVLQKTAEQDGRIAFTFTDLPWGCTWYKESGRMMPEDGFDILKGYDAILLGAVGRPDVPDHVSLHGLLIAIRQGFDQYVNLRPVKLLKGAPCPLKDVKREDVDMIFVRENSEGEYAGKGILEADRAEQVGVFTRRGCERVIRYAFELAVKEGRRRVTSVSKGNALNYSMVFWDKIFAQVAADYPQIEADSLLVDAASMFMVRDPARFDVVVCSNLFGDILTDLGAAIAGGMGMSAGANLNPEGRFPSMFEPVHGSAPDIMGQEKANPMATVWAASQMMDCFGRPDLGKKILAAIEAVLEEGKYRTPDLGGSSKTSEVTRAILEKL
ncbi:MAG: tartrate dehydrogenase [Firmicutes bacterium]|nr:tartrate dehydrogenase [Bacillota bacterium]MBQ6294863.1 tartrate dehydrogenase [Bacillota bacterium]